jgi:flavin reductase (DIM6/NTAB) family NADH-FMN oxidoreductase RutF
MDDQAKAVNEGVDPATFRKTMGHWASGVTVISTEMEGQAHGMTASAFSSLSLNPPLVVVSVAHKARMHAALQKSMWYGVSILAHDQAHWSQHFAGQPGAVAPAWVYHERYPLLEGAAAHICVKVVDAHVAGDHTLYIGLVQWMKYREGASPLVYYAGKYRALAEG